MPNVGGPKESSRRLPGTVVPSIMLNAAPIWKEAMVTISYRRQMISVYRRVFLRTVSAFQTVSYEAVCVIARMSPVELLVEERKHYGRRLHFSRKEKRKISIDQWQQRLRLQIPGGGLTC
ncbi:uncharacterized protein [Halyomorpha halys]|uniref:uncharacterized protein n=1 Tax=Halyomorpha halys TaxID=286706 RepID=UPI0034D2ADC5